MVSKSNKAHKKKIVNDPLFKEYVKYRNLKPETIRSYSRKITIYSIVTGHTPTQLIEQAEEDEDKGIRLRKRRIIGQLLNYQEYLIQNDFSPRKIVDTVSVYNLYKG
jgi:hypothetical protein